MVICTLVEINEESLNISEFPQDDGISRRTPSVFPAEDFRRSLAGCQRVTLHVLVSVVLIDLLNSTFIRSFTRNMESSKWITP